MKRIIAVALLIALMITVCACGSDGATESTAAAGSQTPSNGDTGATIDAGAMVLTEMGTVPDGVNFTTGGIITKSEGEKVQILNQNGVSFHDTWYDDVDSIVSNGICIVANIDADGKELLGVVDSLAEKELVPCEAVQIAKLSDRYLLLCYETGAGTEDDRFGYYVHNGDTKRIDYKGYGKILDLKEGKIVPGVEVKTSSYLDASAFGNMILIENEDRDQQVYKADGTLVGTYERFYAYPDSALAMQYTDDGVCVYDKDMKLVNTLPRADYDEDYEPIDGTSEMLIHQFSKNGSICYCVIDIASGNALSMEYTRIVDVEPEGFISVSQGDTSRTVDFKGNTIVSGFATYLKPGYFVQYVENAGYYLYDTTGKKLSETAFKENSGLLLKDDEGNVYVYETGELLKAERYPDLLIGSLVCIDNNVYDVISGKVVFEDVDDCVATGGNLYVWDSENEQYTRYIAEFQ